MVFEVYNSTSVQLCWDTLVQDKIKAHIIIIVDNVITILLTHRRDLASRTLEQKAHLHWPAA